MTYEKKMDFKVQGRLVTVRVMDQISVEECYSIAVSEVLFRYVTGVDNWSPVRREIKDFLIKRSIPVAIDVNTTPRG